MEEDWAIVKSFGQAYVSEIAIQVLANNNIKGVVMNKKDSTYGFFGFVEVYVNKKDLEKAIEVLQELD